MYPKWSQTGVSILKPIDSLYKQILYNKPFHYHHCHIIQRCHLFSIEVLSTTQYFHEKKAVARGNCIVRLRRSKIGQSAFSVRKASIWNTLPMKIRNPETYSILKIKHNIWLKFTQICIHE